MTIKIEKDTATNIAIFAIKAPLNYIRYIHLTGVVVFSLVALLFIILNINPDFSFAFLKYFSFLNPIYKTGSFHIGIPEIMGIFSVVALALWAVFALIRFFIKKISGVNFVFQLKHKIILLSLFITVAYAMDLLIVALKKLDSGFYLVFGIFYIFAIYSAVMYLILDNLQVRIPEKKRLAMCKN